MHRCFARFFSSTRMVLAVAIASVACGDSSTGIVEPRPVPPPIPPDIYTVDVVHGSEFGLLASRVDGTARLWLAAGDYRAMALSFDGRRVAYARNGVLYVSTIIGTDPVRIAGSVVGRPAWSRDGTRLAFARPDGSIYTVDLTTQELAQVTHPSAGADLHPSWSPDGKRIAFSRVHGVNGQTVWTVGADGTTPIDVSSSNGKTNYPSWSPVWSPDGRKIAFATSAPSPGVRIINADGSGGIDFPVARLTGVVSGVDDWSRDGKWIALKGVRANGIVDAYLVTLDGSYARVNESESWNAVAVSPAVDAPSPPPPFPGRIYQAPADLYAWNPVVTGSQYIISDDGRFVLRSLFRYGVVSDLKGKIKPEGTGFRLTFDASAQWEATAVIDGPKLTVTYNSTMWENDFVNGTYTLVP